VEWRELPQHGVIRGLRDRDRWASRWDARMAEPVAASPEGLSSPPAAELDAIASDMRVDVRRRVASNGHDKPLRQRGGRSAGLALLDSFLDERGATYQRGMSSPLSAEQVCSRLSPHLAFGTVSMREAARATWQRRSALLAMPAEQRPTGLLASLKSFEGRLHWHCHFIQKLESEPAIEWQNMHRGYDGLREPGASPERHAAWCEGRTGYPMIDACMRMLAATGWINFRMRAMLTSFASYHLWLHWRDSGLHLAREFLDYEPGIHWSQLQMQSGTTGINTLRIYSPVKQARDQDPEGRFVRRWVPELEGVSTAWIFEPWRMSEALQCSSGCVIGRDYPPPIVDHARAVKAARERIWAVRGRRDVADEALVVYRRHGSRSPTREGRRRGESVGRKRGRTGSQPAVDTIGDEPQEALDFE
jgi:deoxyribodipyrimidine photo-lyase